MVTPYAGVWIEISRIKVEGEWIPVTPYAGVWIEINFNTTSCGGLSSLPTRECGLKYLSILEQYPHFSSLPTRECGLK